MTEFSPYLNFDGECAEAFDFYQSVLGGERFTMGADEMPPGEELGPEWEGRVIHTSLVLDGATLMASDIPPGTELVKGNNNHVSLGVDTPEEAERVFAGLSAGGEVTMEMEETFYAHRFAEFTDKFGVCWMVLCSKGMEA
jgi:PhnB protein